MKKDKKQGDCKSCKHGKTGMGDGICRYCGITSMNWEPKAKSLNMKRVMELMEENAVCPLCGNKYIGESRSLSINNEIPGKEFVPFHLICACGYEVKVYE